MRGLGAWSSLGRLRATWSGCLRRRRARFVESFQAIAADAYRVGKPLRFELEGVWSARRGPYRVIYRIGEGEREVIVVAVGYRAGVYRRR